MKSKLALLFLAFATAEAQIPAINNVPASPFAQDRMLWYESSTKLWETRQVSGVTDSGTLLTFGARTVILTADSAAITSTTISTADTGISFTVAANKSYAINGFIKTSITSDVTGCKWGVSTPTIGTGSIDMNFNGASTGATVFTREIVIASDTATTTAYNAFNGSAHMVILGIINTGATAGTVTLRCAKVTSGSVTIKKGSSIMVSEL